MSNKIFERRHKEDKPVLAICYDFDKTLSPDDMQAQGYIQSVGYDVADFWKESNELAEANDMDTNLAYMYKMIEKAQGRMVFTREKLEEYGARVSLFPGVRNWFERIRRYGAEHGVIVEHYIISSGLKEMIEGTAVAKSGAFEHVYASSFYYNEHGVAIWPAQVVNYTGKTQILFRIQKGVLDVNDPAVNDHFAPEDIRVPFHNMVYIGDSDTDVPCMKLVNDNGGYSIGVYNGEKAKVYKMLRDGRIMYFTPANYTEDSELDRLVKAIIDRTAANAIVQEKHFACKKEYLEADRAIDEDDQKRTDLIIALENSSSFAGTHSLISQLQHCQTWTDANRESLFEIAVNNSQVRYILGDADVRSFYEKLLEGQQQLSVDGQAVQNILREKINP